MLSAMRILLLSGAVLSILGARNAAAQPEEGAGIVTMQLLADKSVVANGE
jgi:hypothetical protein